MQETRNCQNCKADFVIAPEDFAFYGRISVPPPTFCPQCRLVRRLMFRNERALYKGTCSLCKKDILTIFAPGTAYVPYCTECWYSDKWDPMEYGQEYDFGRPFFEQFHELQLKVPRLALFHRNAKDSPYANMIGESKDAYLSYSVVDSEFVYYSKNVDRSKEMYDCLHAAESQGCYDCVFVYQNYNCVGCVCSDGCIDSWFLYDCDNCQNCTLSTNLRNRQYVLRNVQYDKEEYFEELKKLRLDTYTGFEKAHEEFAIMKQDKAIHKYANTLKATDSMGDNLANTKNVQYAFDLYDLENTKYALRYFHSKDSMDVTYAVAGELLYEYASAGKNLYNMHFSMNALENLREVDYSDHCGSSSYLFGCAGLRNKQYCIFNKQYSKEEYEELRTKIIEQMNAVPYVDKKGREYRHGEMLPMELSFFGYNETLAQEHFPMRQVEAEEMGYPWREPVEKAHQITKMSQQLPDAISEVSDEILNEVIGCAHQGTCSHQCTIAFRLIPQELQRYKQLGIPLPRLCPNCRHYRRLTQRNPLQLWERQCMCDYQVHENSVKHQHHPEGKCPNTFQTSFSPDRAEIVYCEACYQAEVV